MAIPTLTPTAPYFSSRGKKIAIVLGVLIGGVIVYRLLKGVIKQSDNRSEVQEAYNELDRLNQSPVTAQKLTKLQAEQYANIIFTAVDGWGTDEVAINRVFNRLRNDADYIAVSKAFGIRTISSGRFNPEPDYKATMVEALHIDMDSAEKKVLNDILIKKKIKYRI
jgi:alkaline phosphatase